MTTFGLDVPAFRASEAKDFYRHFVAAAESAGFTNLWVGDHLLWHRPRFESFTLLGMLSGMTSLTLGTGIALAPLRPPWWLAKSAATVHEMSEGGFVLGLGTGGEYTREFDVAGADLARRGAALDEAIRYCRQAWSGALGNDFSPLPVAQIPIWLGGRTDVALRRAAQSADGWLGIFLTPEKFSSALSYLAEECRGYGRPDLPAAMAVWASVHADGDVRPGSALEAISTEYGMPAKAFGRYVVTGTSEQVAEALHSYSEAGATHISIHIADPDPLSQVEIWGSDVLPRLGIPR